MFFNKKKAGSAFCPKNPEVTRLLRIQWRLALALALPDDEEENHVPARLWVQISLGEGSSKVPTIIVQELRFDDA